MTPPNSAFISTFNKQACSYSSLSPTLLARSRSVKSDGFMNSTVPAANFSEHTLSSVKLRTVNLCFLKNSASLWNPYSAKSMTCSSVSYSSGSDSYSSAPQTVGYFSSYYYSSASCSLGDSTFSVYSSAPSELSAAASSTYAFIGPSISSFGVVASYSKPSSPYSSASSELNFSCLGLSILDSSFYCFANSSNNEPYLSSSKVLDSLNNISTRCSYISGFN